MTTEVAQLPHIEVFHRVMGLPMIEMALSKSAATYSKVKDSHHFVHWALSTAEASLSTATRQAVPIAAPIARKLESPIHFVDHTLCLGLDKIEQKVPLVKEKPEQILENAMALHTLALHTAAVRISHVNDLIIAQASNLKDKANQILSTHYGNAAVKGIDSTAVVVDKLIDKYFPATEEENTPVVSTEEEDKLLHTLQTVGRLSNKAARRVYASVIQHLRTINKDNIKSYISSLVEFLQLTRYLHAINEKVHPHTNPEANGKEDTKKTN